MAVTTSRSVNSRTCWHASLRRKVYSPPSAAAETPANAPGTFALVALTNTTAAAPFTIPLRQIRLEHSRAASLARSSDIPRARSPSTITASKGSALALPNIRTVLTISAAVLSDILPPSQVRWCVPFAHRTLEMCRRLACGTPAAIYTADCDARLPSRLPYTAFARSPLRTPQTAAALRFVSKRAAD